MRAGKRFANLIFAAHTDLEKLDFSFGVSNILNPTVQYFREATIGDVLVTSANGKDVTDYKRGITSGFSLKYKF